MISSATVRLGTQRSMAWRLMQRWASGSDIFSSLMSSHLARFTRRISSIFSSMGWIFFSYPRSRSRAAVIQFSPRRRASRGTGRGRTNTPCSAARAWTCSYSAAAAKSRTTVPPDRQQSMEKRIPASSGRGELRKIKSKSRWFRARSAPPTLVTVTMGE